MFLETKRVLHDPSLRYKSYLVLIDILERKNFSHSLYLCHVLSLSLYYYLLFILFPLYIFIYILGHRENNTNFSPILFCDTIAYFTTCYQYNCSKVILHSHGYLNFIYINIDFIIYIVKR